MKLIIAAFFAHSTPQTYRHLASFFLILKRPVWVFDKGAFITPPEFRIERIAATEPLAVEKSFAGSSYGCAAKSRRVRTGVTTRGINLGPDSIKPATMTYRRRTHR